MNESVIIDAVRSPIGIKNGNMVVFDQMILQHK